ncbi:hypothetical protein PAPHI01_2469 [Pancytospora philotis]|nr:hypothetical protein PAPHI01_2469 [Pancytospora philotis]
MAACVSAMAAVLHIFVACIASCGSSRLAPESHDCLQRPGSPPVCAVCTRSKIEDGTALTLNTALNKHCHCVFHQKHRLLLERLIEESDGGHKGITAIMVAMSLSDSSGRLLLEAYEPVDAMFWVYIYDMAELLSRTLETCSKTGTALRNACAAALPRARMEITGRRKHAIVESIMGSGPDSRVVAALLNSKALETGDDLTAACVCLVEHLIRRSGPFDDSLHTERACVTKEIRAVASRISVKMLLVSTYALVAKHGYIAWKDLIEALPPMTEAECVAPVLRDLVRAHRLPAEYFRHSVGLMKQRLLFTYAGYFPSIFRVFVKRTTARHSLLPCVVTTSVKIHPLFPLFLRESGILARGFPYLCAMFVIMRGNDPSVVRRNSAVVAEIRGMLSPPQEEHFAGCIVGSCANPRLLLSG